MQPSDRVLVHAAAGGVGLAAIQVVQAEGGTVLATAGGTAKRSLLHSLGVQHVLGSRDTSFASEAAELGGADIVLNSLTSAGMVAGSLAAMNAGGRFVEISKRDIWSVARVAQGTELHCWHMALLLVCFAAVAVACPLPLCAGHLPHRPMATAERPDVRYSLVAVDFLPPAVVGSTLRKVARQLAAGVLRSLRHISHTLGSVANAFRQMIQVRLCVAGSWMAALLRSQSVLAMHVDGPVLDAHLAWPQKVTEQRMLAVRHVSALPNASLLQARHVGKVVVLTECGASGASPAPQPGTLPSLAISGGSGESPSQALLVLSGRRTEELGLPT